MKHSQMSRYLGLFLLILMLTGSLMACKSTPTPEVDVRVGVLAILSGNETYITLSGQPTVNGANLAVQQLEQAGWITANGQTFKITLVVEDDGGTPETATAAASRLINQENVVALIGPQFSSNAIPVATIAEQAGIPMISPMSTAIDTTAGKRFVFRVGFIDSFQGRIAALFAHNDLSASRAAVWYNVGNAYSQGLADTFKTAFESAGGAVVAYEAYTEDQPNYEAALARIADANPDVIFLPNLTDEVAEQTRLAREAGLSAPFLGGDTWNSMDFANLPALEGAYYITHWNIESDAPESQAFVAAYQAAYPDSDLRITSALTYDAMELLFQAIRDQGAATPQAIRDGLAGIQGYQGVSGAISYGGTGDPIKSAVIMHIQNGATGFFKLVTP